MNQLVAVLLVTLAAAPGSEAEQQKPSGEPAMSGLRDMALSVKASELNLKPTKELPHVWGVVMEYGFDDGGVASLVALGDGTASLYLSQGGGILGAGGNRAVRCAVDGLLKCAEMQVDRFTPTAATPPPGSGRVRIYVRTFAGTLLGEASEKELASGRHDLSTTYIAGKMLLAVMQAHTPSQ